jgi:hypothetical protein
MDYTEKYLKYKQKYMALKRYANQQRGGSQRGGFENMNNAPAPAAPANPAVQPFNINNVNPQVIQNYQNLMAAQRNANAQGIAPQNPIPDQNQPAGLAAFMALRAAANPPNQLNGGAREIPFDPDDISAWWGRPQTQSRISPQELDRISREALARDYAAGEQRRIAYRNATPEQRRAYDEEEERLLAQLRQTGEEMRRQQDTRAFIAQHNLPQRLPEPGAPLVITEEQIERDLATAQQRRTAYMNATPAEQERMRREDQQAQEAQSRWLIGLAEKRERERAEEQSRRQEQARLESQRQTSLAQFSMPQNLVSNHPGRMD